MLHPFAGNVTSRATRMLGFLLISSALLLLAVGTSPAALAEGTGGAVWPVDGKCPVGKGGEQLTVGEHGACVGQDHADAHQIRLAGAKATAGALLTRVESGDISARRDLDKAIQWVYRVAGEEPRPSLTISPGGEGSILTGSVPVTTYQQINSYYCGPATAETILRYLGPQTSVSLDTTDDTYPTFTSDSTTNQARLANFFWLATDNYGGTNWGSLYMPFTLNAWHGGSWYIGTSAGSLTQSTAWDDINVDMHLGFPIAENVRYKSGVSYIPQGFASGGDYQHWDGIYGNYILPNGTKYVLISQVYRSPGLTWYPYQSWAWNTHWPAISQWNGIVW